MVSATMIGLLLVSLWAATAEAGPCQASQRERYEPRTFLGYACDDDCEGHKAGFAWAERHGIADPVACTLNDAPAIEGCRAYAADVVTAELAGFEWASDNEVADPCLCRGAGPSFEAGCRAFVTIIDE